ncbi:unnamed protein product [Rotaria sordida]|uniref:Uncharacterized protein n=1 Tax=Rotaria sordida TaxID=392033 RepID=A0A815FAU4_9BILA|nr:unnamed protein product [Rotaria sordida]
MIELPDLFHENRISELTLSLILYVPIGLCLVLIRSITLIFLFLISSILPASLSLDQFINKAISFILTFICVDEAVQNRNEDTRKTTKIIVANRVSCLDLIVLRKLFFNNKCKMVNLWEETSWINYFKLNLINSARTQEDLLDLCVNEIQYSDYQLLFVPECEPTTGSDGLLKFNLLPFSLAKKLQLSILPICLRTSRAFKIRTSTFNSHPFTDLFWFLFSPYTRFHINFLSIVSPTDLSSDEVFCEQIRENICRTIGIELTQFDEQEVSELKKRPDLVQRRHEQRRAEFQQMINLVHQQVPLASLEAIRYDLEITKSVQRTIANLNERVVAAARAANKSTSSTTSSHAITKSSGGSNHRQAYERLKQELIEKNRQLFLNKNVHDKRFRSSFHSVINELRNEKRMPLSILQSMPRQCCTCHNENEEIIEIRVITNEENELTKLKNLIERVNQEKQANPKLILSLNILENLIEKNRSSIPLSSKPSSIKKQKRRKPSFDHSNSSSSSSSDDSSSSSSSTTSSSSLSSITSSSSSSSTTSSSSSDANHKTSMKPIKNGTFLFLPYTLDHKTKKRNSDSLLEVAKELQCKRFIGPNGHFSLLEKQYNVRINMITSNTSKQVTDALENAKKGLENLKIRNQEETMGKSENLEGEWVLIRSKKSQNQTKPDDIEQVLDDLINRWENCLKVKKRSFDKEDDSDDSIQTKK